jgi:hypothetical protein
VICLLLTLSIIVEVNWSNAAHQRKAAAAEAVAAAARQE